MQEYKLCDLNLEGLQEFNSFLSTEAAKPIEIIALEFKHELCGLSRNNDIIAAIRLLINNLSKLTKLEILDLGSLPIADSDHNKLATLLPPLICKLQSFTITGAFSNGTSMTEFCKTLAAELRKTSNCPLEELSINVGIAWGTEHLINFITNLISLPNLSKLTLTKNISLINNKGSCWSKIGDKLKDLCLRPSLKEISFVIGQQFPEDSDQDLQSCLTKISSALESRPDLIINLRMEKLPPQPNGSKPENSAVATREILKKIEQLNCSHREHQKNQPKKSNAEIILEFWNDVKKNRITVPKKNIADSSNTPISNITK